MAIAALHAKIHNIITQHLENVYIVQNINYLILLLILAKSVLLKLPFWMVIVVSNALDLATLIQLLINAKVVHQELTIILPQSNVNAQ